MATPALRAWRHVRGDYRWFLSWVFLLGCDSSSAAAPAKTAQSSSASSEAPAPKMVVAANNELVRAPLDATPSPDGDRVFYTALTMSGGDSVPGVFGVSSKGGDVETLAMGGSITAPVGISISMDGEKLYLADSAADAAGDQGALLTLASSGGDAAPVSGTEGYAPRGVVVAQDAGTEWLYFTGTGKSDRIAGLFRVDASGGMPESLVADGSLLDPGGVAVADNGDAYVVDGSGSEGKARLLRVHKGVAEVVVADIGVGFPAGLTLTKDGTTALVSGLDPVTKHDVVYFVELATKKMTTLSKPIAGFSEPAGLHRAHHADVFAWADSEANGTGTVYVLTPHG